MITGSPCIATILAGGVKSFKWVVVSLWLTGQATLYPIHFYSPLLLMVNKNGSVWVSSSRIRCVPNGDFSSKESSVGCYAWFVWKKGHHGETAIRWFNRC